MLGFTAALLIISTPQTVVTIPNPDSDIKHAAHFVTWSARAQMGMKPKRLKRLLSPLGIDPFEPSSWSSWGIAQNAPLRLWISNEQSVRVLEFQLNKKKMFDKALSSVLKSNQRTQPITEKSGLWYSSQPGVFVALIRNRKQAYLLINAKAGSSSMQGAVALFKNILKGTPTSVSAKLEPISDQDQRLDFLHSIKNHVRPKYKIKSNASFWIHRLDSSQVYASSPVYATDEKVRFEASISSEHLVNEEERLGTLKKAGRPRKLFATDKIAKVAAEARLDISPFALTEWAKTRGIPVELDRLFTGLVHAVLMQDGAVMLAATLHKKTTQKLQNKFVASMKKFSPKLNLLKVNGYRDEQVWLMWYGDVTKESIQRLFIKSKPQFMDANYFSARPPDLLKALRNRSARTDALRITGAQMLMVDLAFSELMLTTQAVTANLVVSPKKSQLQLEIQY
ncbi:MAG: hypothetical protein VYC39_07605 [Myxococcota bacterium]|nr:hypothetical protein [Myxococcota bacterium]